MLAQVTAKTDETIIVRNQHPLAPAARWMR